MPTRLEQEFASARVREESLLGDRPAGTCAWCSLKLIKSLSFKCAACLTIGGKKIRYCGQDCQAKHWQAVHKYTCCRTILRNRTKTIESGDSAAVVD